MGPEDTSPRKLRFDAYRQSQADLRDLKERMHRQHVEDLAGEVIRRLANRDQALGTVSETIEDPRLEPFCQALISDDDAAAAQIVSGLLADNIAAETIYLTHLARAARLLGAWWSADRVSFIEVTLGSARLLAIMRSMRHLFQPARVDLRKSAVFAAVPGETHFIGVTMAADIMRKEGWDVWVRTGLDHDALVAEIERADCTLIGLSFSGDHAFEPLARLVVALHICRPELPVVIGGPGVETNRSLVDLLGVDYIATDINAAKAMLPRLLAQG